MAVYKPLKGLRGTQLEFTHFQFQWDSAGNDYQAHYLWIFKEDEMNNPQMRKYATCTDNRVQAVFQYNNIPLQEIQKMRFLVFLSDVPNAPSSNDIYQMSQRKEFLCEVYCGNGEVTWKWERSGNSFGLQIYSNKKIPQGLIYYSYVYGNKQFRFDVPGEIQMGNNSYSGILFPELPEAPRLQSAAKNVTISEGNGPKGDKKGGLLDHIAHAFRH